MDRTISVYGVGSFSAPPDTVCLTMKVRVTEKEYEKSLANCAEKQEKLTQAFIDEGFDGKMLKTVNFFVDTVNETERTPDGDYRQVFKGYRTSHSLSAEFPFDTELLGKALSAVASCLSEPELEVRFTLKNPKGAEAKMLADAASTARGRAQALAAASGVTLGELVRIEYSGRTPDFFSESDFCAENLCLRRAASGKTSMAGISPEDISAELSALFIWEIK